MASLHPRVRMILTADIEMKRQEWHQQELSCLAHYGKMCAVRRLPLSSVRARAAETMPSLRLLPVRRRSCESARTNPALHKKTRSALSRGVSPDSRPAERLAECCLPLCCKLFPDGWMQECCQAISAPNTIFRSRIMSSFIFLCLPGLLHEGNAGKIT